MGLSVLIYKIILWAPPALTAPQAVSRSDEQTCSPELALLCGARLGQAQAQPRRSVQTELMESSRAQIS